MVLASAVGHAACSNATCQAVMPSATVGKAALLACYRHTCVVIPAFRKVHQYGNCHRQGPHAQVTCIPQPREPLPTAARMWTKSSCAGPPQLLARKTQTPVHVQLVHEPAITGPSHAAHRTRPSNAFIPLQPNQQWQQATSSLTAHDATCYRSSWATVQALARLA